jgi:hypothetical protein
VNSIPDQGPRLVDWDSANAQTRAQWDLRRLFRTWTHVVSSRACVARKAVSAEAICTFTRLARGLGRWRVWTKRGHVALGAAYHARRSASSLAFLRWVQWATQSLEASARSVILVSLLSSSRLLKMWRRLLRGVDAERCRDRELRQRTQSLHGAWTQWIGACAALGTPQTSCESPRPAHGTPPDIDAIDQAANVPSTVAPNMVSSVDKDPSDLPGFEPTPCTGHPRAAELSPAAAEAQPASSLRLLDRLAAVKAAVRGPTPARMLDTSSLMSISSLESLQRVDEMEPTLSREELIAQLKEARFTAQMGETDLEREGGRARVRLLQAQLNAER